MSISNLLHSSILAALVTITAGAQGAYAGLASGPMLGPVSMREANVWLQTEGPSDVRIVYTEADGNSETIETPLVKTSYENRFCVTIPLSEVEPGKTYNYHVVVDGQTEDSTNQLTTPAFYHGKTPPPDIRFAVIGANYNNQEGFEPPYQTLGSGYEIFDTILENKPQLNLWLGGTAQLRVSDWESASGYLKRFAYARSRPEMAKLLANCPNYAIWGSADYGPSGAGALYSKRIIAEKSFRTFWPQPGSIEDLGLATRFSLADADFFVLDVQSHRLDRPVASKLPEILGEAQIEWLRRELMNSQATFKFVVAGAPILNPASNPKNLSYAEREQKQMLQTLRDERISGLFFLSGGKSYGELTRLVHANSYNLYDLTVGPVTAKPLDSADELNFFRMPGTSSFQRHFALIDITGPEENRELTIRVINAEGTELWKQTLKASQLIAGGK